jgi:hypothetical protein
MSQSIYEKLHKDKGPTKRNLFIFCGKYHSEWMIIFTESAWDTKNFLNNNNLNIIFYLKPHNKRFLNVTVNFQRSF